MSRHAADWTLRAHVRDFTTVDQPGKHHPIWDMDVELAYEYLEHALFGGRK